MIEKINIEWNYRPETKKKYFAIYEDSLIYSVNQLIIKYKCSPSHIYQACIFARTMLGSQASYIKDDFIKEKSAKLSKEERRIRNEKIYNAYHGGYGLSLKDLAAKYKCSISVVQTALYK